MAVESVVVNRVHVIDAATWAVLEGIREPCPAFVQRDEGTAVLNLQLVAQPQPRTFVKHRIFARLLLGQSEGAILRNLHIFVLDVLVRVYRLLPL